MRKIMAKNIILTCLVTMIYCTIWTILELIIYKTIQNRLIDNIMIITFVPMIYIAISRTKTIQSNEKVQNNEKVSADSIAGYIKIKCPYSGQILSIKASVGDYVKKGDTIIVLDALKMETPITAPEDGIVAYIGVREKSIVERETILFSLY